MNTETDLLKWILGGLAGAIPAFGAWWWRQHEHALTRERDKNDRIRTLEVSLAVAETKLAAYGKSAPELVAQIDQLAEQVAQLLYEDDPDGNGRPGLPPVLPWPSQPPRPTARRRSRP